MSYWPMCPDRNWRRGAGEEETGWGGGRIRQFARGSPPLPPTCWSPPGHVILSLDHSNLLLTAPSASILQALSNTQATGILLNIRQSSGLLCSKVCNDCISLIVKIQVLTRAFKTWHQHLSSFHQHLSSFHVHMNYPGIDLWILCLIGHLYLIPLLTKRQISRHIWLRNFWIWIVYQ